MSTLTDAVKRKLKITWADDDTDARIADVVADAVVIVNNKIGASLSEAQYASAGLERSILENWCMYEWYNRADEFDKGYANDIAAARRKYEVTSYDETE